MPTPAEMIYPMLPANYGCTVLMGSYVRLVAFGSSAWTLILSKIDQLTEQIPILDDQSGPITYPPQAVPSTEYFISSKYRNIL
jgi:hypothetical protein